MAYRSTRVKLFCRFQSRIVPKAVTSNPILRDSSSHMSRYYSTISSKHASISDSCSGRMTNARKTFQTPFLGFPKRNYPSAADGAFSDPDTRLAMVLFCFEFAIVLAIGLLTFGRFETIPCSKRRHLVLLGPSWEKELGKLSINYTMNEKKLKDSMLPDTHPDTIRIRAIAKDLIWALERTLDQDHDEVADISSKGNASRCATILDKKSKKQRRPSTVSHLDSLEWEILVVDKPNIANAACLPGGKILVFTGLLKHFSNAEIATIIGHEVGHAIARHGAETLTNHIWLIIVQFTFLLVTGGLLGVLFTYGKDDSNILEYLWQSNKVIENPLSRRMEVEVEAEADYIGLLLLASAGYDPLVAPSVYIKLTDINGGSTIWNDYSSTHPSGETRAKNLNETKVMGKALCIYEDVTQGLMVKGFL